MTRPPITGVILWEGPNPIDGAPLVCIMTTGTKNPKTGPLAQTWIMRSDMPPHVAAFTGRDVSCCGGCHLRPYVAGQGMRCYVRTTDAPRSVFEAFKRGNYPRAPMPIPTPDGMEPTPDVLADWHRAAKGWDRVMEKARRFGVRAGAYGDPAMVPARVWATLPIATGYTHQWRAPFAQAHKAFCMASCDGPGDVRDAQAQGWRTFEVVPLSGAPMAGAVHCPAVVTDGRVTCSDCRLCGGDQRAGAKSIYLYVHGAAAACTGPQIPQRPSGRANLEVFQ